MILDEPTAALGVAQTGMVLRLVRRLAEQGYAVMIVSHNLIDVFEVADRIAVLRLGMTVAEAPASQLDRQSVVELHDDRYGRGKGLCRGSRQRSRGTGGSNDDC